MEDGGAKSGPDAEARLIAHCSLFIVLYFFDCEPSVRFDFAVKIPETVPGGQRKTREAGLERRGAGQRPFVLPRAFR
jgi:hypothetical protein